MAFSHTIFVFIAPNLVYLHNLDINKVGSVSGTSVLLHLSHCSSLCDAISGVIKAQKWVRFCSIWHLREGATKD